MMRLYILVFCLFAACSAAPPSGPPRQIGAPVPGMIIPPGPIPIGESGPFAEYELGGQPGQQNPYYSRDLGKPMRATNAALVVPLSGKYAKLGQGLRDAATIALFDLNATQFNLKSYDSAAPGGAVQAARQAVQQQADIILGPLFADNVRAVKADRLVQVPILAFSNDQTVAGDGAYTLGFSPEDEVLQIMTYAASRGLTRVAALLPHGALGLRSEKALRQAAAQNNQQLVTVSYFEPEIASMGEAVERLKELAPSIQAIFTPVAGSRLRMLIPLLPYHEIIPGENVQLLGVSRWEDPSIYAEELLSGALFPAPPIEGRKRFSKKFIETYADKKPTSLATLGYDATALAIVAARQGGINRTNLENASGYAGVNGIFRLRGNGTVERSMAIYKIQSSGAQLMSPARTTFEAFRN